MTLEPHTAAREAWRGLIAVLFERLGPYHAARMRSLAEAVGPGRCVVIEVAAASREYDWDPVPNDGFRRITLFERIPYERLRGAQIARAVADTLGSLSPAVVAINGWHCAEARAAAVWCRTHGRTAVLMSESQERDRLRNPVLELLKRHRVADFDAGLVGGACHAAYLAKLGMSPALVFQGYDIVDNEHFASGAAAARGHAAEIRRKLGLPERFVLASARFLPKKNIAGLLRGYALYRRWCPDAPLNLVLLGDGPLRGEIVRLRDRLRLVEHVSMLGFRQYHELPTLYGLAEALIIPSIQEQWGLVVNEAMAAGLPVLASSACGAAELVEDGRNGFVFDPRRASDIARVLLRLHATDRWAMGRESQRIISRFGPSRFAAGLLEAVEAAERRGEPDPPKPRPWLWGMSRSASRRGAPATPSLAVIIERVGPYHQARMRALARALGGDRLLVLEIAAESSEYEWEPVSIEGVRKRTLIVGRDYRSISRREKWRAVLRALEEEQPGAVAVNGWAPPEARGAAYWCQKNERTTIVMSASQQQDFRRTWAKEYLKSLVVRGYDAALVGGASQAAYLERLGLAPDRVFRGYDAVDNDHFAAGARSARSRERALRAELELTRPYFLCVARFLPKKNLFRLLQAYAEYRTRKGAVAWDLVIVGEGPLRAELEATARAIGSSVRLLPFKTYEELPVYYGLARALVLPSITEQWGLVVNEAMAAGLPVIVSDRCGCAADLVEDGKNGLVCDPLDVTGLAAAMDRVHGMDLAAMGARSQAIVATWGLDRFARGMLQALERGAVHRHERRAAAARLPYHWLWF